METHPFAVEVDVDYNENSELPTLILSVTDDDVIHAGKVDSTTAFHLIPLIFQPSRFLSFLRDVL